MAAACCGDPESRGPMRSVSSSSRCQLQSLPMAVSRMRAIACTTAGSGGGRVGASSATQASVNTVAEVAAARAASAPERCFMTGNRNWSSSWLHADGPVQANGLAVEHFVFEDLSHERCIFVRPAEALRKRHLPAEGLLHLG